MRITIVALLAMVLVGMTVPAFAELQNVEVGGSIRIRGNWYSDAAVSFDGDDDVTHDAFSIEQRTTVNVKADFTDDVTAFIELDAYNLFGEDFRGVDAVNQAGNEYNGPGTVSVLSGRDVLNGTSVNFYQGYIEMREAWGYPISFRIGRQELQFGSEFLVGNNDTAANFRGLSFDGLRADYNADQFDVTAFWSRVATTTFAIPGGVAAAEESGDVDLMGVYGSYTGLEDMTIDAYWLYLRDTTAKGLAPGTGSTAEIHTIGARFAGVASQFDWDVEGAYQVGDTGLPAPFDDISSFAFTGEGGYTFDVKTQPRIFAKGAYFDGDKQDPAFNRLFSDHEYSEFLANTDLTNVWLIGGGVSAQVTEEIELVALATYYQAVEEFANADDSVGTEVELIAKYQYSEDLYFEAGYAHFFAGDGIGGAGGLPITGNGGSAVGTIVGQDDDQDYVYIETGISF